MIVVATDATENNSLAGLTVSESMRTHMDEVIYL